MKMILFSILDRLLHIGFLKNTHIGYQECLKPYISTTLLISPYLYYYYIHNVPLKNTVTALLEYLGSIKISQIIDAVELGSQ